MGSITIYTVGVFLLTLFSMTSSYPSLSSSTTEDYTISSSSSSSISPLLDPQSPLLDPLSPESRRSDNKTIKNDSEPNNPDGANCQPGLLLSVWLPQDHLTVGDRIARGAVYFLVLVYLFIGVSIVSDRFMAAIEVITSKEKEVKVRKPNGEVQIVVVRVWNETVANLTLMALGSSAPEILLSIIEIMAKNFNAGELGPGKFV